MTPVAVVAGVGQTRFRRRAGVSEHALGLEAVARALKDAGLRPTDVDGVVRFDREAAWEYDLPAALRLPGLSYYGAVPFGAGSAPALLGLAKMAVEEGMAQVVVGWHARDGVARAGERFAGGEFQAPLGVDGVAAAAMVVRAWLARRGLDRRAVATARRVLLAAASSNPRALRAPAGRGRLVASPLCAEDVAAPAVGACAFVVTRAERTTRPVRIVAVSQAAGPHATRQLTAWFGPQRAKAMASARAALWLAARRRPADVDVACAYADPAPLALLALDDWGLDPAAALRRTGRPRTNPHGGQLGEASLDGINDVVEAVRQLRGDAARPVRGARLAFVCGSPLEPTSAALLERMA